MGQHILPHHKAKQIPPKLNAWISQHQQYLVEDTEEGIHLLPEIKLSHLPAKDRRLTYDTQENRFVRQALQEMIRRLQAWDKHVGKRKKMPPAWVEEMGKVRFRFQQYLHHPYLQEVGQQTHQVQLSTVLRMGPGYREFYRRYLLMKKGLSIAESGVFQLDLKDIATLYEYWCLLSIIRLLQQETSYEMINQGHGTATS